MIRFKGPPEEAKEFGERILCSLGKGKPAGPFKYGGWRICVNEIAAYHVPERAAK